jgi:hypothetical protein
MLILVRHLMQNSFFVGLLSFLLVVVPVIGMHLVHKYGWEHWEPFKKNH